jgi:hypothetical protein
VVQYIGYYTRPFEFFYIIISIVAIVFKGINRNALNNENLTSIFFLMITKQFLHICLAFPLDEFD